MSQLEGPYQGYDGGAVFVRRCPACGRIVKADEEITVNGLEEYVEKKDGNAACTKCGRVEMDFLGWC